MTAVSDPKITRRRFIGTTGAAALMAGCGGSDDGDAGDPDAGSDPRLDAGARTDTDTDTEPKEDLSIPEGKAAVGVVGGVTGPDAVEAAVRRAVALAGGLDAIQPGQTVFIKPNAVHPLVDGGPALVTSNAVLSAMITLVRERNPGKIIVGDRSARFFESDVVFEASGMGAAALAAGADEVYAAPKPSEAPDDWVLVQPPKWEETWEEAGGILVMKKILDADHLINMPVCKNHRWAVFSLALKNFIGGIGDDSRDPMHYTEGDPDRLSRDIVILNQPFQPLLNVLDAGSALLNGGPDGIFGDEVRADPGLILASRDRVALDVMGASILQHWITLTDIPKPDERHGFLTGLAPWKLPQIVAAQDLGIDLARAAADVLLRFDGVAEEAALTALFETES